MCPVQVAALYIETHLLIDLEWDVSCTGCCPIETHLLIGLEWDVSCTGCCPIETHLLIGCDSDFENHVSL